MSKVITEFSFDLEKLNKKRAYVLSDKEEKLLAQAGEGHMRTCTAHMAHIKIRSARHCRASSAHMYSRPRRAAMNPQGIRRCPTTSFRKRSMTTL